ncbi:heterocyst-inhibiting protein PatX [Lyngbya sp. CCY1209]|jgi:hypothetical protein|uniref:heterocyst-inhibiting protein PatX n=1 Tax=Lyngbya sp. CCY1209 TaxID=2886103 RepID=UPI002D2167CA|nr:hypothetical protein [Lyngbya sp. CCY1209]MEB3883978.1 hypothetical protein [Lyngbya sp. CCY1209]
MRLYSLILLSGLVLLSPGDRQINQMKTIVPESSGSSLPAILKMTEAISETHPQSDAEPHRGSGRRG